MLYSRRGDFKPIQCIPIRPLHSKQIPWVGTVSRFGKAMPEDEKVRKLLNAIRTDNPDVTAAMANVRGDLVKKNDFVRKYIWYE